MFEGLRLRRQLAIEQARVELARTKLELAAVSGGADRLKRSLQDADESAWSQINTPTNRALDDNDSSTMRAQACKLYYRDPIAKNIIRLMEKYVAGRGFFIAHKVNEKDLPQLKAWWDDFWKRNKMRRRVREIVRRGMRDGEVALREFKARDGQLLYRFMDPDKIKPPIQATGGLKGNDSHGIVTDPDDVESILGYWYDDKWVPGEEVIFAKIIVDSDVKRGRSFLEVIMPRLSLYAKWLTDRMKLNYIRSLIGMSRKVKGSPAEAANLAAGYETTKVTAPDKSAYHRAPEGVSVVTHNEGVEYEFLTPNLQAADVQHDGRTLLLSIAAGAGLPEFMVSSNAENANYASTLIAEGPAVMEFEDWQDFWEDYFQDIYERAIKQGIALGTIPAEYETEEETETDEPLPKDPETGEERTAKTITKKKVRKATPTECDITFPEIVHREILQETQALVLQAVQGWVSAHTAAGRLNLEYDEERKMIRREEAEDGDNEEDDDPMAGDPEEEEYRRRTEEEKKPKKSKG